MIFKEAFSLFFLFKSFMRAHKITLPAGESKSDEITMTRVLYDNVSLRVN